MLPDGDDLPELLLDLAVPHEEINELVAGLRRVNDDPGALRLLRECVEELFRDPQETGRTPDLAELLDAAPAGLGGAFAVYVFLAAVPHTLARHRERGIPTETSRRTLADLGRHMAVHRRRYGTLGVHARRWLVRHFRGELYQLGRLQFERARLGQRSAPVLAAAGLDAVPGTPCLNLHIPDFHGPLTPAACDRSLALAREFFALHFPEERPVAALCHSWLLDPQLKQYLPADSNIVRFQERFRTAREDTEPSDTEPVQFVFGAPDLPVARLPRRTSVERAVGDHLRAGGHWYIGHGWFPFPFPFPFPLPLTTEPASGGA
ncbi:acyltransferase [Streptomyces yokosukanensis]|uniref:Acyltransferase n=1 Tax=Streptomyces yokosukanensis TaxID=67386 RepID=A0A101P2U7_9ACTN|nr:acyltransferase domain-containing protein [Streptomyces yokosukanensis]KUN03901.1 acyltransferase [Streptomyces yokosukanensis]